MVILPQHAGHSIRDGEVCSSSAAESQFVPPRNLHQWMGRAKLESQDGVPEIVPVDDELRVAQEAHNLSNSQSWNGGWILSRR